MGFFAVYQASLSLLQGIFSQKKELAAFDDYHTDIMNSLSRYLALVAISFATLGLGSSFTGCASTPTRESAGEFVDDSTITTKVKAALIHDPVVKALDVKVETFKGVVQLSGFVNSASEKLQAGTVAASVSGVTSVKNDIVVK